MLTLNFTQKWLLYAVHIMFIPGASPVVGRRPTMGCARSKITHVHVLSWPFPLWASLSFLRVTEVLSPSDGSVTQNVIQNSAVIGQLITQ